VTSTLAFACPAETRSTSSGRPSALCPYVRRLTSPGASASSARANAESEASGWYALWNELLRCASAGSSSSSCSAGIGAGREMRDVEDAPAGGVCGGRTKTSARSGVASQTSSPAAYALISI
jgi:hypothetical protein